jgi:hypothetical protein
MNKEITTLLTRMLNMVNGLLAIAYVSFFAWVGVQLFNILF